MKKIVLCITDHECSHSEKRKYVTFISIHIKITVGNHVSMCRVIQDICRYSSYSAAVTGFVVQNSILKGG